MNISQVVNSNGSSSDIRIWSHWHNLPVSDSYEFAMYDGPNCGGESIADTNIDGTPGRSGSMNISGQFSSDMTLAFMD